ncbi:Protein scribble [Gossypium arboreum]|uniref:Protein scribble n=1 Tax=Gossypium arboreum TaxID=29729 RepID=A0A0B0P0A7_GOSAR|nr:Protein scribble [Gossypium arboreum]
MKLGLCFNFRLLKLFLALFKHLQVYLIQLIQVKTSRLDGSSNRIKELPSSLGNCSDLSDLKVSNNLITSLPEDLTNCLKLTKLDVERLVVGSIVTPEYSEWFKKRINDNIPRPSLENV